MNVAILLATYNGEKYLCAQLDSLISQSYKDYLIYISDDCSTDKTKEIISEYISKFPDKIIDIQNKERFASAKKNFINLLYKVDSDLFLFCDQDDVWEKDHVEKLINIYSKNSENDKIPVLVHSDLTVVNNDLQVISKSFFNYSKLPKMQNKRLYFLQNNVTGCACLINRKLKDLIFLNNQNLISNYDSIPMHDILFAVIAAYFGKIIFVDKCLVNYRQHEENVVGAQSVGSLSYIKARIRNKKDDVKALFINFFCSYFKELLPQEELFILQEYINIKTKNKIRRWLFIVRNGFLKTGIPRKVYQLLTA